MKRGICLALLVATMCRSTARGADAPAPPEMPKIVPVTPAQIEDSIKKAIDNLYSLQQPDGSWETPGSDTPNNYHYGGLTSLVTYSLLAAHEDPQKKPELAKAVGFLKKVELKGIYSVGCRCQVWLLLPQTSETKAMIKLDAQHLLDAVKTQGDSSGKYDYVMWQPHGGGRFDHSVSNFGVLGMWACEQTSVSEVPVDYWKTVDDGWRAWQNADGGWDYAAESKLGKGNGVSTANLTAAGTATLFITQEYIHGNDGIECKGNVVNPNIERGLKWMATNFGGYFNDIWAPYGLYGVERVGVASGYKYIGNYDWFQVGAAYLCKRQAANGSFGNEQWRTAFALLFFVRGRAPVIINKLQYELNANGDKSKVANWNQRPRDAAHLARYVGRQIEHDVNWQIVNLNVDVDELHDAPILYLAGNQPLAFTDEEEQKLRLYVEQGGLIVGNADCGNDAFTKSFRTLGTKLFPRYEFTPVPKTDFLMNNMFASKTWKALPNLVKLGNDARTFMVLIPHDDFGKLWQTDSIAGHEQAFQAMTNIVSYATDRGEKLRTKGVSYIVKRDLVVSAPKPITVARLEYEGNWDPEPGGWRRLSNVMHNANHAELTTQPIKLGAAPIPSDCQVAHLTGTSGVTLKPEQIAELKRFVTAGGTLVLDNDGGLSGDFKDTLETQLSKAFGQSFNNLGKDHAIYKTADGTLDVKFRSAALRHGAMQGRARLRGMDVGGRTAVILSPEDLSTGLVGEAVDNINGYDPDTATALMGSILLYAANPAAPPPATNP